MKYPKLTKEEQVIEDSAEQLRPVSGEIRARVERVIERSKKNEAISLRISGYDLDRIKKTAERQGMPYQTLINVILHKYVTNQLYDKDELLKTLQVAKERDAI
jgi:predicted DNA binding CopG/RHH family protein